MTGSYKNLKNVPILLWAIPSDEFIHPCATDVSLVFIKDCVNKNTYWVSFNHPDCATEDKNEFITFLNQYSDKKWAFDKKSFIQLLPVNDLLDVNLISHLNTGDIIDKSQLETNAHKFVYRTKRNIGDLNKVVPLMKHLETFEKICQQFYQLDTNILESGYTKENSIIIETLAELESNGIYVNGECFSNHFNARIQPNGLVYSQYNIYTSTGRPSNHFDGVNYAALNKDDGTRKCFTSRHGKDGMMVLVDYSAFHPRIISYLINFDLSIDDDIYKYLGKMYFNREVNEYDAEEIKSVTMRQLYGNIDEKYKHIKYLTEAKNFINENWNFFKVNGYVRTPIFNRIITHIQDANPGKLFSYILQATETEVAMTAVKVVNDYLKHRKTKVVLYTYDSLLFDFHKDDGEETLKDLLRIMKMGNRFPVKIYIGESYDSVVQINL